LVQVIVSILDFTLTWFYVQLQQSSKLRIHSIWSRHITDSTVNNRNMLDGNTWPVDMTYSKCSMTNITAVTRYNFDLRKAFLDVITQDKQNQILIFFEEQATITYLPFFLVNSSTCFCFSYQKTFDPRSIDSQIHL
jgi:hypothetical protein